jgi:hypothetical protein
MPALLLTAVFACHHLPATALSLEFGCIFEPGSAVVSVHCRRMVAEAAAFWAQAAGQRGPIPSMRDAPPPARRMVVGVHGFAPDATGAEADALALRRALTVTDALGAAGVPLDMIIPVGFGGMSPRVPSHPLDPLNLSVWLRFDEARLQQR